jgi:hypothetical protein
MTATHWRTVALVVAIIAAAVIVLSVRHGTRAERQADTARATLTVVRSKLGTAETQIDSALGLTYTHRAVIDSLTLALRSVRLTPRPPRQTSARLTDVSDVGAVVEALATITAERDTALLDLAAVREQAELIQQHCDALRTASIEHARAMEAQLIAAQATIAAADSATQAAAKTLHRGRLRRVWDGTKRVTTGAAAVAIGFTIGRLAP